MTTARVTTAARSCRLQTITTILMLIATIANVIIVVDAAEKQQLKVGDSICTVGYVMDSFCIDRGTLLDNPSVSTLGARGPLEHSVHCLVDVPSCVQSPFEILQKVGGNSDDSTGTGTGTVAGTSTYTFGRSFRVENNDLLVDYAKTVGQCAKGCTGDLVKGLQVAVTGKIINLGEENKTPALIRVMEVGNHLVGCEMTGDKDDVIVDFEVPSMVMDKGTSHTRVFIIHGCLMLIAWGLLLPAGAITAKFSKHRPDNIWFHLHKKCQMIGLVIGIIGWIIISKYSAALSHRGSPTLNYPHALLGTSIMIIGCLQPLNALCRPHKKVGEEPNTIRRVWEVMHKGLGWGTLLLAVVTISFGTTLLPTKTMQTTFQICYGVICGGLLLMLLTFLLHDKRGEDKEIVRNDSSSDEEDEV